MFSKKVKTVVSIEGMSCSHCANKVKTTLEGIESIKKVKIDLDKKEAIIWSSEKIDENKVREKIENLEYEVLSIREAN